MTALFLALSPLANATGIPVVDAAHIATDVANQIETMAQWVMQIEDMKTQIANQEQQFKTITGSRNLGEIMNNAALRDYLPSEWQRVYDDTKSLGYSGLSGSAQTIYAANKVYDACAAIVSADQRTACEARAVKPSQDEGFAQDAFTAAKSRMAQIDGLMQTINATQDPKDIAELQSRISIEQANIQNEQTKLQLYQMVASAEDRVQKQRENEYHAKTWAARGVPSLGDPLTFNNP